jgi:DNA primase
MRDMMKNTRISIQGCTPQIERKANNNIHSIKEWVNPQEFYAKELNKNSNKSTNWIDGGVCPFHQDKRAGSFKINQVTGAFKCFSCGAGGGDVIDFTMALYGLSFRAAIAKLANEWGIIC